MHQFVSKDLLSGVAGDMRQLVVDHASIVKDKMGAMRSSLSDSVVVAVGSLFDKLHPTLDKFAMKSEVHALRDAFEKCSPPGAAKS